MSLSSARPLPASTASHEQRTDGLRAMAALLVVYTHMLTPVPHLDPAYAASPIFWRFDCSQGAVLLFFVLSGYVIGLTNQVPFRSAAVGNYAWRRLLRIFPLYAFAVVLSVAVHPVDRWPVVLGNLFFLQNDLPYGSLHLPPLAANTNLWSLNYEVLYYALFPLVWASAPRWRWWLAGTALLGVAAWRFPAGGAVIASYAAGWTFWLAGYGLARAPKVGPDAISGRLPWPSLLLLWFVTWRIKPLWWFAHRFGLLPEQATWMNFSYYDFVLPCVALLMVTSDRRPTGHRLITGLVLTVPVTFALWRVYRDGGFSGALSAENLLLVLACLLWFWRPSSGLFRRLAGVGAISYGIYIFHSPAQWLVRGLPGLPSGSAETFAVRGVLALGLTFGIAWLGERWFQPWLRARLGAPRRAVPKPALPA